MRSLTIRAWEFDKTIGVEVATQTAIERLDPPDLEVVLIAARGDVITVQVVEGSVGDREHVLYVAGRGLFEILRAENWPPLVAGGEPRLLLTLKSWPSQ